MKLPVLIDFGRIGDEKIGFLSIAQALETVPFAIKRVNWMHHVPTEQVRGNHAYYSTKQVLIPLHGQLKVTLEPQTGEKLVYLLDNPQFGLYIPPHYWRWLTFGEGAVAMLLSSEEYDKLDTVYNYQLFRAC
jgi:hypothetical protein